MITSAHTVLYAEDAAAARRFFRDVLGFAHVDAGEGWLIFGLPPSELGVHPTGARPPSGSHELFFVCHDIEQTVRELTTKGVEFAGGVTDAGFGLLILMKVPGAGEIGLYEPRHPLATTQPS